MGGERSSRKEDRRRSSRDRSRDRDRDDRRHKDERRDKDRSRRRSRSRSRSRSRHKRDRSEERARKRSRHESSPRATPTAAPAATQAAAPPVTLEAARAAALAGHDAEEARRAEREAEQVRLDAEMEKRRKRIQAWQEQRRKEEEAAKAAEAAAGGGAAAEPPQKQKVWTLENESSDEDEGAEDGAAGGGDADTAAAAAAGATAPGGAAPMEEDEVDPLDAFMQTSVLPAVQQAEAGAGQALARPAAAAAEEEEVDPLDAFMQSNVLPAVQQQQEQQPQQPAAAAAAAAPAPGAAAAAATAPQQGAAPVVVKPAGIKPLAIRLKIGPGAAAAAAAAANGEATSKPMRPRSRARTRYDTESSEDEGGSSEEEKEEESEDEAEWMRKLIAGKLSKGDKLMAVDHASVQYPPFRRNFYIEVPELARMTPAEVDEYRRQLDGVKVRGKDVPKPVKNWHQCGLSSRVLDVLRKGGFERPLSIQAQALPVIMSGRDCIGIAKTGSGKTLAFVLPMLRHVKDQPPLAQGDGPVALSMAPTRELVVQISKEVKRFAKAVGLTCVAVYGGSGVANQITELKRGTEIVVCTPGRMIDILVTSGGKITNLRRVTYLVLDEADRMFDMGFEPQIMRIVQNIRPDRQTVMFSATFPRQVEVLARQVLNNPVEIQVGGRSVVNKDITQYVEIRPEEDRFLRLLEVLGEWYEKGKLIIFVSSQDRCDTLFRDLLRAGYPCLSLHGGKDQSDRESTIADFKANVCNILVATSVAARGLDVKDLVLVVNYDVPNHHEDYVHRVGRTGRAGNKGTAITFIGPDEAQFSPDLVKALKESGAPIPQDLQTMADEFLKSCKEGKAQLHSSGFGGTGFKFDASEDNAIKAYKKSLVKDMLKAQGEEVESESDGDDDEIREVVGGKNALQPGAPGQPPTAAQAQAALLAQQQGGILTAQQIAAMQAAAQPAAQQPLAAAPSDEQLSTLPPEIQARIKAARELAAKLTSQPAGPPMAAAPGMAAAPWQAGATPLAGAPGAAAALPAAVAQPAAAPAAAANPILAAAQAAAARLAKEAGLPQTAFQQAAPQQPSEVPPGVVVAPVAGAPGVAAPGMAPAATAAAPGAVPAAAPGRLQIPSDLAAMMLGPDGQLPAAAALPGAVPAAAPGRMQIPSDLAAMMLGPDGQLPAAALPGAVPGALPGALPGMLPGMVPGALPAAPSALAPQPAKHFETELEINDFPQHARWKITHRETIRDIGELGAAVVVKGKYYKLGTAPGPNDERKLYLHIEGPTAEVVKRAKQEIKRILEESTEKAMRREGPSVGRYSIV